MTRGQPGWMAAPCHGSVSVYRPAPPSPSEGAPSEQQLIAYGVQVSDIDVQPWGALVAVAGPDGNTWTLQQPPRPYNAFPSSRHHPAAKPRGPAPIAGISSPEGPIGGMSGLRGTLTSLDGTLTRRRCRRGIPAVGMASRIW